MADFTPIETQEDFDKAISARLQREKDKYKDYLSPEQASEKYKGYLSPDQEKEKYKDYLPPDQVTALNGRIKDYEISNTKMKVALEKGLPIDLADRLQGTDEESIKADAEKLAAYTTRTQMAPPYVSEPDPTGNSRNAALKKMLEQMKG